MRDWLWCEIASWIPVDQLLRWGDTYELKARGVLYTARPGPCSGRRVGDHLYYWRGPFEEQLRGVKCRIVGLRAYRCAQNHCRRTVGVELALLPVHGQTRSTWHVVVQHAPCGCGSSPLQSHVLSARP